MFAKFHTIWLCSSINFTILFLFSFLLFNLILCLTLWFFKGRLVILGFLYYIFVIVSWAFRFFLVKRFPPPPSPQVDSQDFHVDSIVYFMKEMCHVYCDFLFALKKKRIILIWLKNQRFSTLIKHSKIYHQSNYIYDAILQLWWIERHKWFQKESSKASAYRQILGFYRQASTYSGWCNC